MANNAPPLHYHATLSNLRAQDSLRLDESSTMLRAVLRAARQSIGCDFVMLVGIDPIHGHTWHCDHQLEQCDVEAEQWLSARVTEHMATAIIEAESHRQSGIYRHQFPDAGPVEFPELIMVPVASKDEGLIGMLCVAHEALDELDHARLATLPGFARLLGALMKHTSTGDALQSIETHMQYDDALVSALVHHSADGILAFDRDARYYLWNQQMEAFTGLSADQVIGHFAYEIPPFFRNFGEDECLYAALDGHVRITEGQPRPGPMAMSGAYFEARYSPIRDQNDTVIGGLAVLRDITERKTIEEHTRHLAMHDPLTELPNRMMLMAKLDEMLDKARAFGSNLGVLFMDLDGFKAINDTHGHAIGDAVLRETGRRIRNNVRSIDVAARLGGDEFTVILADIPDRRLAEAIAQRLLQALHEPYTIKTYRGTEEVNVSVSIGVAIGTGHASPDELLHISDVALYDAKRAGKARIVVAPGVVGEKPRESDEVT